MLTPKMPLRGHGRGVSAFEDTRSRALRPALPRRAANGKTQRRFLLASSALPCLALACAALAVPRAAYAQAFVTATTGQTVSITSATATCGAPFVICYEAVGAGATINAGIPVSLTIPDNPTGNDIYAGAYAHDGGTINLGINLANGGTITVGSQAVGLQAGNSGVANSGGTITANNIALTGAFDSTLVRADFGGQITLNGTTTLSSTAGTAGVFGLMANESSSIIATGPVNSNNGVWGSFAVAQEAGARLEFNGGGNVTAIGQSGGLFSASQGGTLTMSGMTASANTSNSNGTDLLNLDGAATINITNNSIIDGINSSGVVNGLHAELLGGSLLTLDNSRIVLKSAGRAIWVDGSTTTVTLTNNAAITAYDNGAADSLAYVANFRISQSETPGSLTLNATDSTLSGNVLVEAPGPGGLNSFAANLDGSTQWTGNVAVIAAPSTADISLGGTARWTGAATNVTSVTLGSGTMWTMTGDSSVTGTLTNGSMIAFQNSGPFKTLTVNGSYMGNGGTLAMNTQLGGDNSPTDRLVLNGAAATGTTTVTINNSGGGGGQTSTGIPVIVAENGGSSSPTAFRLAGPVVAGGYQYQLFQGLPSGAGGSADEQNTWYLRNNIPNPVNPPGPPIPLHRPEGPIYSTMAGIARSLSMAAIGTFHDRNGDQGLVRGEGASNRVWGRIFGDHSETGHAGGFEGRFKGNTGGVQSGVDVYWLKAPSGYESRVGFFGGYSQTRGDVSGFVLGQHDAAAGDLQVEAFHVGGYWTQMGPPGWYVDTVVMGSRYDGRGKSINNIGVKTDGYGFSASIEVGYPIPLPWNMRIEPQAQLIYQHLDFSDSQDAFSSLTHDASEALASRIGARLTFDTIVGTTRVSPYLKANVWHYGAGADRIVFSNADVFEARTQGTAVEVGAGVVAQMANNIGFWAVADYTTDVFGDGEREVIRGNAGVRWVW